jgi:hypothetical protein
MKDIPYGLIAALMIQRQIDRDGTEVGVSRQAIDEAIELIQGYRRTLARYEAALSDISKVDAKGAWWAWVPQTATAALLSFDSTAIDSAPASEVKE